ncbi:MAG: glycosyltransferase [Candidatus Limnocylindrales bacterium]
MSPKHPVPWVVLSQTRLRRRGGDLRRGFIFEALATRTAAVTEAGLNRTAVSEGVRRAGGRPYLWRRRVRLASSELLTPGAVVLAKRISEPVALDVHDHAVAQADALGRHLPAALRAELADRIARNLAIFALHVVPSATFAELIRLDPARIVVAPNGADLRHVVPQPFPAVPALGFVSGAAPGRGIEALIEAARRLRAHEPELRLHLWITAHDQVEQAYLDGLRAAAPEAWIEIEGVPYAELGDALGRATVLVVPHPANPYLDSAVPVKLLDSMAAGRPVVVTPRTETRRIVEAAQAGAVAAGDGPDDLAAAILPLLEDAALAKRLGANGRLAVERDYDWRIIGERVADAVLQRAGG